MAKTDQYSQIGYISVTQSAANTLTFNGISIMTSFLSNSAMILHEVLYQVGPNDVALMTATQDAIYVGVTGADNITTVLLNDPEVYDMRYIHRHDMGAAASGALITGPIITDFTDMPGGGVLVPADRIYGFVDSTGLASAITVEMRFRFTILELSAQEYLELAQALRVLR